MKTTRIGGAALNQVPIAWQHNKQNIVDAIREARRHSVDVLCLPELCISGYGCEDLFLSSWVPERSMEILSEIAPECENIAVAVGLPIRIDDNLYNCAAYIADGEVQGFAAKQFLANDGVHYEPRWFWAWLPGATKAISYNGKTVPVGDLIFERGSLRIGFEICEDAWSANRPALSLCHRNVNLILNPSASHFAFGKSKLREKVVVDGSREYRCYYVYANLLGNEAGRMIFDGEILIAAHGKVLAYNRRLSHREFNLLYTDIHPGDAEENREGVIIPLEDKCEIFTMASSLGLYDYLRKSKSRGFVLSLSGGADSSACALLVAEMVRRASTELGLDLFLGKIGASEWRNDLYGLTESEIHRVLTGKLLACAYQGTVHSSESTFLSAKELAGEIGAMFYHWSIDDEVKGYIQKVEGAVGRELNWDNDDIALQNIQSRARSPVIWMLANIRQALLLVTSNRSEGDVGYATMDGDTSGSLAPVAAVDKKFVLEWLKWAEVNLNYASLRRVNSLTPTAELRPLEKNQTDEDDLMPYPILLAIEREAILQRKSPLGVFEALHSLGLADEHLLIGYIDKFFRLWSRHQWKRERTAPAFHLDEFNIDPKTWCRFPILSGSFEEELELLHKTHPPT